MIIHPDGEFEHSHIRPKPPGAHVTLRAEMDLLAALSTCPDVSVGGTTGATVTVLGPSSLLPPWLNPLPPFAISGLRQR